MKHVNYLSFFLLTLFSISFISCSDDDDNKLNTGITNQSWTEGKSLEISQDNELSVSFNAAAKWVASVTSGADWCKLNTTSGTNGGGHTMSANLIATCIAGTASQGKVFSSLRYNDERMAKLNNKREDELFAYSSYPNLGTSLSAGSLNLPRVYCLVGNGTASASELVINSLEGIDLDVILIGEKTTGKNVGMEYEEYTVRNNTYRVVPITFQSYNAKGFGEYEKGFEPDILMDETNPYNEQGVFYIHKDYGNNEEPLYAKAIELITGTNPAPQTRSAVVNTLDGKTYKLPAIFRPGHDGMLMPARHAE